MNDAERWAALPEDLWVVLRADKDQVQANYRPELTLAELEAAGKWARERAEAFSRFQVAGVASDGYEWIWSEEHAVYYLFGREKLNR